MTFSSEPVYIKVAFDSGIRLIAFIDFKKSWFNYNLKVSPLTADI
jgi:hypothetical protein